MQERLIQTIPPWPAPSPLPTSSPPTLPLFSFATSPTPTPSAAHDIPHASCIHWPRPFRRSRPALCTHSARRTNAPSPSHSSLAHGTSSRRPSLVPYIHSARGTNELPPLPTPFLPLPASPPHHRLTSRHSRASTPPPVHPAQPKSICENRGGRIVVLSFSEPSR